MKIFLFFLLDIYGNMHKIFSYLYVPWFSLTGKERKEDLKFSSSALFCFTLVIFLTSNINNFTWLHVKSRIVFFENSFTEFEIFFALFAGSMALVYIDYWIFFKTKLSDIYDHRFANSNIRYKILTNFLVIMIYLYTILTAFA